MIYAEIFQQSDRKSVVRCNNSTLHGLKKNMKSLRVQQWCIKKTRFKESQFEAVKFKNKFALVTQTNIKIVSIQ